MSQREWHDGVVDVADELVQRHGPSGASVGLGVGLAVSGVVG